MLGSLGAALISLSVLTAVSVNPTNPVHTDARSANGLRAVLKSTITRANECVAEAVMSDPRFQGANDAAVNELIVDRIEMCKIEMQSMMAIFDNAYGDGTGEKFFMGQYLDELPAVVKGLTHRSDPQ